ncbi:MAG TPA: hypothetical protein VHR72_03150 [Gemmataceae bacterium]|jgi:hypothetical protein|nr:hypothetical protein [Gemmataceae bacterium]
MLSEEQELLLTAFVDGDVTREERESIECLLRNSSEARNALRVLQENAHRLKKLSKTQLGQRFTSQVLASLPAKPNGIVPHEPINITTIDDGDEPLVRKPRLRRGMPNWAVGAIAASLILGVLGIGASLLRDQGPDIGRLPHGSATVKNNKPKLAPPAPRIANSNPLDPVIEQMFQNASRQFAAAPSEAPRPQAAPPMKLAFADLKEADHLDQLTWELKRQESVRLDVHVRNEASSLNRLIDTFHKHGIHLTVTARANANFKQNLPVLVYAENVGPDRLAKALRELSDDYISGTKRVSTAYDRLQMTNGTAADALMVARGLGVALERINKRPETPASPDHAEGVVFGSQADTVLPDAVLEFLGARRAALPGTLQVFVQLVPKS